jgi:Spy/CpxP family protein refolding chaperone
MNTTLRLTFVLGLTALLVAPASAQRPGGQGRFGQGFGGGMGGQGGLVQLLMAPPVQEELALSDDQIGKIEPISEQLRSDMMSRMQEMRGQLADLSPEQRRERFEKMSQELNAKAKDGLKGILKEEQLGRLEQIHIQQQGVQAFTDPTVLEALKLTEDQKAEVDGILESYRSETREIMEAGRETDDRAGLMGKLVELRRSSMDKASGVLTDEQRTAWKELTGEPFTMGPGAFGPGGGRRGGGRPGSNPPSSQD